VLAASLLALSSAAMAQTTVDVTGRVVRVDPGSEVFVLDDHQAFRVTPGTTLLVDNRPATLATIQPGQAVVIRSGEPVQVVAAPPATPQAPAGATVIASPGAPPGLAQQTTYGRIVDVDSNEVKIKTSDDDFHVRVPPELAAQLREDDSVRLDLTFRPAR